ncbi:MAG: ankyrin repeat domain-containing protein [Akkermansiaceae bacterium]
MLFLSSCEKSDLESDSASGQALLDAVMVGNDREAALLLTEGAYTEVRNDNGDTPIIHAVKTGNVPITRMMLQHQVDTDVRSSTGRGLLELSLDSGNEEMALLLLGNGVSADEVGHDGNPLLLKAVKLHDIDTIELLLANGVEPSGAGKEGVTPLHVAAQEKNLQCISLLLSKGADAEARDDQGATPLWYLLNEAASLGDTSQTIACFERFIKDGATPAAHGKNGETLLNMAIKRGVKEQITMLMDAGAPLSSANSKGETPLSLARDKRDTSLMGDLLARGADGSAITLDAVKSEDLTALKMLKDHGVKILPHADKGLEKNDHIIASIVRKGKYELLDFYLALGADVKAAGHEGESPLHMAVAMRDAKSVALLLSHGANPNVYFRRPASKAFLKLTKKESSQWFLRKDSRLTPLMIAANNGDLDVISSLLSHGAKKYVYSGRHRLYPLNFASRRGDVKAMQVILGQDPEKELYHAVLDLSEQRVRVYNAKKEVIFSSRVSTGKSGYRTPTGTYVVTDKHRKHTSSIYGSSMPYFQRLSCSAFGFHSGNCPGYPASHGCIRMPYSSAKKLFGITPVGTRVVIQR